MKLVLLKNAQKELDRIEDLVAFKISQKILQLADNPYSLDSKKLEGGMGYRIRIGNYRVIYTIDKSRKTVCVIKVAHRREVYR